MPGSTTPLVRGRRGSVSVESSGIRSPGQRGVSPPDNAGLRPRIPRARKPLRCSGDRDGALHDLRVVLAEERVAAGGRGREGDLGVLAALDVLVGAAGGEGEVVLDAVLVGHLEGVAGT